MKRLSYYLIAVIICCAFVRVNAQDSLISKKEKQTDSLQKKTHTDDTLKKRKSLDSLVSDKYKSAEAKRKKINHRTDSVQKALASPTTILQSVFDKKSRKKNSITKSDKTASNDSLPNHKPENDSLKKKPADSTHHYNHKSLDSLQKKFHHRTDSLQRAFASPMNLLEMAIAKRKHKKDSLSKNNQSTGSLDHEIDSLQRAQSLKLKELNTSIEKAKKETLAKANALHLPPQAQSELNSFTKNINGFKVPNNFFQLPGMKNLGLSSLSLPSGISTSLKLPSNISIPQTSIPSLQKMDLKSMKIPSLAQMKGPLDKELKQLQALKSVDAKTIEKEAMNVAGQNKEMKSLLKEESQVKDLQKQLNQVKSLKSDSAALQQLKPAVNHFAGKEKELTAAMDKVSKLKQKYSNVTSLAELPKRAPNPLKGKPWIERFVPGLNYFIQNKHYTLVDFNPYVGWRFNPKLTATIGWNQRIGIRQGNVYTHQYDHVYGVRASATYLWTRGINFKIAPELMSAYIPTNGTPDVKHEALVFGVYAGIRKDFPIYKSLKGYSEVMYNFTQKTFQNIYGDPVSFRFGMELRLKKKAKKNSMGMVNPSSLKNKAVSAKDSFHIVRKEKLFGVIGIKGDTIVSAKYQSIKKFLSDGKLYFIVKRDKKFGALSSDGKESVPLSHQVAATVKFEILNRARSKYQFDKMMNGK